MELNQKKKIEEEISFKDLAKSPIRLFGWIFLYFFLIVVALGIFFGYKLIPISFNIQTVGIIDSTIIKKEIPESQGGIIPAVDLALAKTPGAEMIAKGKELYDANCQSCHVSTVLGDGPAGIVLNPKPRNFHSQDGWTNGSTIGAMYKTLQEGIISRGMAAYEYLPPQDRLSIIHYIRSFSEFSPVTDEQISGLDKTYNLSVGVDKPNTIPISKAMVNMEIDNSQLALKVTAVKSLIFSEREKHGAEILIHNSYNLDKVLLSFINLTDKSFDNYVKVITGTSISTGYRPTILRLSNDELRVVFDYLMANLG